MKQIVESLFKNSSHLWKIFASLVIVLGSIVLITKLIQQEVSNHFENELITQQSIYLEKMIEENKHGLRNLSSRWLEGGTYKLLRPDVFNKKSWAGRLLGLADATKNDFGSLFFLTHNKTGKLLHRYNTRERDEFFNHENNIYKNLVKKTIESELSQSKFIVLENGKVLAVHTFPITDEMFNPTNVFTIITDLKSVLHRFKNITNLDISLVNKGYVIGTKVQQEVSMNDFLELRVLQSKEISKLMGAPKFIAEVDKRNLIKDLTSVTNKIFLIFGLISIFFILLYFRTVKKLKHQEAKSYEASRLSSLGEMAGSIAHEINNPLTVIQGYAIRYKLLAKKGQLTPEKINEFSDAILEVIHRITNIIKSLRNVSRNDEEAEFKQASTHEIVCDAIYLSQEKFKIQGVDLIYNNAVEDVKVSCRRVEISRVLINLLNNSLHAVLESTLNEIKKVEIDVSQVNNYIVFKVSDNGDGIPKDIQSKIMEPFFTTKGVEVGTGLGLSLSLQVANAHSGSLELTSEPGNTVFSLKIPL